jgi:hypothetical protein
VAGRLLLRSEPGWYRAAVAGLLVLITAVGLWNAYAFNHERGYDGVEHIAYARDLAFHGHIPGKESRGEYYSPPLFYAIAGGLTRLAPHLGVSPWEKLAQGFNAAVLVLSALLVLVLARLLWPGRRTLHVAALGFFCFVPVTSRTAAMFHPEPLDLLLSLAGLTLAARILRNRSFGWKPAVLLGVTLGAAQLARTFGLYAYASVAIVFCLAAVARYAPRRQLLVSLAVTTVATLAVAGPWYARQAILYTNPVFDQPTPDKPVWERQPLSFYVDPGLPDVLTTPMRPSYKNRLWPQTYSELWGDYYGIFMWNSAVTPTPPRSTLWELRAQAVVGLLPTALSLLGIAFLLRRGLRRSALARDPAPLLVAVLPLLGFLGYLYFTVSYPVADGDTLKATYMLTTAPAWALAFGLAGDGVLRRLRGRPLARFYLVALLVALALVDLRAIVYRNPLGGLF